MKATQNISGSEIGIFISMLSAYGNKSDVENQYSNEFEFSHITTNNLHKYLTLLKSQNTDLLLVGEAPGYNGCRWTGIPFTAEKNITIEYKESHLFGARNGYKIRNPIRPQAEASATIVWNYLKGKNLIPAMWNAFPFHPHIIGDKETNRKPTKDELSDGKEFLIRLIRILDIKKIIAIGNVAHENLNAIGITCSRVRHPANGGKNEFISGMERETSQYHDQ